MSNQKKELEQIPVDVTQKFQKAKHSLNLLYNLEWRFLSDEDRAKIKRMDEELKDMAWRVENSYQE